MHYKCIQNWNFKRFDWTLAPSHAASWIDYSNFATIEIVAAFIVKVNDQPLSYRPGFFVASALHWIILPQLSDSHT